MEGAALAVAGLEQPLSHHPQQGLRHRAAHGVLLGGGDHPQDPLDRAHGRVGVQGAKHQVTGLGGLEGGGQGLRVADLADQDHIGVFAQGRPQGVVKLAGVLPHLAVTHQRLTAFMHELHRILDREDVAGHVGVDPVDHCRQGGALA